MDASWLVRAAEEIVSRLDFASATPGRHWSLGGRLHGLDCLLVDLKAAAAGRGLDGAQLYGRAHQLKEELAVAVEHHDEGDLAPWRSGRDRVFELLATIRASCPAPAADPAPGPAATSAASTARTVEETARRKCEMGEKLRPRPGRRRGRVKNRDGDSAADRAAFWMTTATDLIPDGDALQESLAAMGLEPSPKDVYEAMKLHGLEITLGSVRNKVPACWPRLRDGSPRPSWSFTEYAADVSVDSFARNLRVHRRMMRGRDVVPRAASKTWDLQIEDQPRQRRSGPSRSTIRTVTIVRAAERVEDELGRVRSAMLSRADAAPAWGRLRRVLVEDLRVDGDAVDKLMGQRDEAAIEAIATIVIKARKMAGDTGDFDPKGRLV